jgi:NPCBM/NEW2 domain-containing protein
MRTPVTSRPARFALPLLSVLLLHSHAFGADAPAEKPVLRVVYFTPNDREPIPGYVERLDKVLKHIRAFYRDGMEAAGYGPRTFDLDRKEDGTLRVFVVRGEHPTEKYGRDSGWTVQQECRKALLEEGIDLKQETALILNNLLLWEGDKNVEHGPYAGGGNHLSGFAWAYDDAMFDPDQLGSKEPGGYFHRPCSVGKFNSHYIGGIAHELGHGLGLPHVCQKKADRERGTALMGAGNHTWGREQRGEDTGTFLTTASAMQLSRNRLFADELNGPQRRPTCRLEEFDANWKGGQLTLSGRLAADPPAHGVIVFNDDDARRSDYDAVGWTTNVDDDGSFEIDVKEFRSGKFQLRLMACHTNGQKSRFTVDYEVAADGEVNPGAFLGLMLAEAARAYSAGDRPRVSSIAESIAEKNPPESITARKARHLLTLLEPMKLISSASVPSSQKSVSLTDLEFLEESVGWRRPTRDRVPVEVGSTCFLEAGGKFAERGLYAHAPSRYAIKIGKAWKRLTADLGVQTGHPGSVVFVVRGDDRELFRSKTVDDQKVHSLDVDLSGVDTLELIVENAGNGNAADWGVWLEPTLKR